MHKRIAISWDVVRGYHVDLPTYQMIGRTWLPLQKNLLHEDGAFPQADPKDVMALKPTVIVMIPDDECVNAEGQICRLSTSKKYAGHPVFSSGDWTPPLLHDFHPIELDPPKDMTLFQKIQHRMGIGK